MKQVVLIGMKSRTEPARIGSEVVGFIDFNKQFAVVRNTAAGGDSVTLKTVKGSYTLHKSLLANRYQGKCGSIKVHVCLKKISGKIIYWG